MGGVGRATEVEEDIDVVLAREALRDPSKLLTTGSDMINDLLKWASISSPSSCLITRSEDMSRDLTGTRTHTIIYRASVHSVNPMSLIG